VTILRTNFIIDKCIENISSKNVNSEGQMGVNNCSKKYSSVLDVVKNNHMHNKNNMFKHNNVCSVVGFQGLEDASVREGDPRPQDQEQGNPECA
jgi:hypothetical protein